MFSKIFRAADGAEGPAASQDTVIAAPTVTHGDAPVGPTKIAARDVSVFYGGKQALYDVSLDIPDKTVTALIGPSGCGKSTFLRTMNRMNDTIPGCKVTGRIEMDGVVESALKRAGLWDEVADRLQSSAVGLSGGQQQRLVIARAIAVEPEVILMDEPCSALDPIATAKIEELMDELREDYCLVIVTHSMAQAARVSQRTAFFHMGELVEFGDTETIFQNPRDKRTLDYITGRFG